MKRKKRKEFSITKEYKKSWAYVKESKNFIYAVIGIFVFFALVGFFIPAPEIIEDKIMEFIRDLLEKTENLSQLEMIKFLLVNNAQSTFLSIFLGVLLGIFPVINTIMNGYVLGFVSAIAVRNTGILELWRILPHGIFELPAVFISLGLGIKLGTFIFQKKKMKSLKEYIKNSLITFLLIVLPLLIIAGIIEGTLITLIG